VERSTHTRINKCVCVCMRVGGGGEPGACVETTKVITEASGRGATSGGSGGRSFG